MAAPVGVSVGSGFSCPSVRRLVGRLSVGGRGREKLLADHTQSTPVNHIIDNTYIIQIIDITCQSLPVFQLGLFLRALRPARTGLRPALFTRALPEFNQKKKIIYKKKNCFIFTKCNCFFVFSDSRCKNACKMLADLCPCFHQSPTRPNFGRSRVKVCPILCRFRTKLCPNFGCSRARLCPISFAPCPFPNLAGTLITITNSCEWSVYQ